MESKDTRVHLVAELEKLAPKYPEINFMIEEAKAGEYHDYKNKKYTCGKTASAYKLDSLFNHYKDEEIRSLSTRIKNGEFDETPDEEDKEDMRKILDEMSGSPERAAKMKNLLGL